MNEPGNSTLNPPDRDGEPVRARYSARFAGGLLVLLGVVVLAGCAGTGVAPEQERSADVTPAPSQEIARPARPTGSFPREILYKLLVAEFAVRRGQLPLAVNNYLEAARVTRSPAIAQWATRIAIFARDADRGLEAATLWRELNPAALDARQVLAALFVRTGRVDDAVAELEALLAEPNQLPEVTYARMGEMLGREKDKQAAVAVMERIVAAHPGDQHATMAFVHLLARTGDLARASALLDELLKRDPKNVKAAVFQARVFRTQGNTPEALESLSDALELQPDDESLRITYARLLVDAKRYEDAREQFERLVRDAPDNVDVRHALGLLLMQTNHMAEARGQFEKLVKMGQRRDTSYYYLGQIAESENETDKAIAAYRHVDRGEQYLNAQIRIALLLAESGDLAAARGHLHALPQGSPADSVRVYRAEAEVLARVERHKDAMKVYDMALEEHPGNGDLLYARAMLATKLDRMDILERDLREILSRDPDNADALNALGYTLADRSQRYEDALVLIKRALQLKPDDFYVLDSMGWVMYRLQRYPEAIEYLRRAIALQNDPEIAAHLGEVLWVTGDHKGAQEVWEAALESTPDDERLLEVIKRFRP